MKIRTLQRLLKFQGAKLGVALMVVTAGFFLIPAVSWAQNNPPIADAGEDQTIFVDQPTTLEGSATDPDGDTIVDWLWEIESFPAGSVPSLSIDFIPNPTFQGNRPGDYVLSLIAFDGTDWSEPDTVTIHVVENLPPVAVAAADVTSGPPPLTVNFDGSGSYDPEGGELLFRWLYDDGSLDGWIVSPSHVYEWPGRYNASFYVEDDWGQLGFDNIVITVCGDGINCPPVADAGEDQTIFVDQPTLLDGTGSFDPDPGDSIVEWSWAVESQPPGSTVFLPEPDIPEPSFRGNVTGDYILSLVVSDGEDWSEPDTVTITVVVNQPPVAIATADVTSGPAPLTVQFDGSGSYDPEGEDLLYSWRPGDGSPGGNTVSLTHVYELPGVYTAVLTVEDDRGQQAVDTIVITVTEPGPNLPPVASADGPFLGTEGMPCSMDASDSSDPEGAPLTYSWNFDDGSTMVTTEAIIEHTYQNAGTYFVTLVVNDGELDSTPLTIGANIGFRGGQRSDVDSFLVFSDPLDRRLELPAGTKSYDVRVVYGQTIDAGTFEATLNKQPFAGFNPVAGTSETITIPLSSGKNTLKLQVDGERDDGRVATDKDTLTFIFP